MKIIFKMAVFKILTILFLNIPLVTEKAEASSSIPPSHPIAVTPIAVSYWWEIPFQPPEKWFTPKWEDDEWYKRRQQQKYRKRR
jgi:hypothetical protein